MRLAGKRILLIVTGGIAAYKAIELARLLRRDGAFVTAVLTEAAQRFVTPLSLQTVTESRVHANLWSLTDEQEIGHIQLSRQADLLVVMPASADFLARMAAGLASDLATTIVLATDKPVLAAPAMNVRMWHHAATQHNIATLRARGIDFIGPDAGEMACHEFGLGRLVEPASVLDAIISRLRPTPGPLSSRHAIVTSGPTHEAIDPVRFLANRSSGRQGHAIAAALAQAGATVTLVHGPVAIPSPAGVRSMPVESAAEMRNAVHSALPADIFIGAAAVADWRPAMIADQKLKKRAGEAAPTLVLEPTADILAEIGAAGPNRPALVIGFAAETEAMLEHALAKRERKNCDWLLANPVGAGTHTMGGPDNTILWISAAGPEFWPSLPKTEVATRLVDRIVAFFDVQTSR